MNTTLLKKMTVTNHSLDRYIERVHKGQVTNKTVDEANQWFTLAIEAGEALDIPDAKGMTHYIYQGHTVVYEKSKNKVITVKPYKPFYDKDSGYHDIKDEMSVLVTRKLMKNIKVLKHQHRQLMIAIHKEEIKRLSVFNPNTQDAIARKVFKLQQEVAQIENKIKSVELVAEQYGAQL